MTGTVMETLTWVMINSKFEITQKATCKHSNMFASQNMVIERPTPYALIRQRRTGEDRVLL